MKKEDIIILGKGGHAQCLIDIIEKQNKFNILGITDIDLEPDTDYFGYPILGNDEVLPDYLNKGVKNVAIGVGGYRNNLKRTRLFKKAKALGFFLPPIIHPSAVISRRSRVGEGSIIFPGAVLNEAEVGINNIIATQASVDHNSIVGDHVLISAGVTIGGDSKIGDGVLCALGSKIISGINIAKDIVVGAGAVVVSDLTERGTYMGCPAKLRTFRKEEHWTSFNH